MKPFLHGTRVLDLTHMLPGPFGTLLLADLGAEVIKVERPDGGDANRHREPMAGEESHAHRLRNRNKRSVALDLKDERGLDAFFDLVETADALVEAFRPGTADRLGIGYDDVRSVDEDIVYCSLTGYGQDGPYSQRPGHDLNYIGVGGLLSLTGPADGEPTSPGYPVSDFGGGLYLALAIAAGLASRARGNGGGYVDIGMTDAVASFGLTHAHEYFGDGTVPERGRTMFTGGHPAYGVFEAADGELLTISAPEKRFWDNLCDAIDRPDLKDRHVGMGSASADDVAEQFRTELSARSRAEWLDRFDEHDVPAGPVNDYDEVYDDEQLRDRAVFERRAAEPDETYVRAPLEFGADRLPSVDPAPALGGDSTDLLAEIGYSDDEIEGLVDAGVVGTPDRSV